MNRELKFRAWNGKEMVLFNFIDIYEKGLDADGGGSVEDWGIQRMPQMQFTGLKDKNGKEIYEGDILRYPDGRIEEVQYVHACFIAGHALHTVPQDELNIIGNIYENPHIPTHND